MHLYFAMALIMAMIAQITSITTIAATRPAQNPASKMLSIAAQPFTRVNIRIDAKRIFPVFFILTGLKYIISRAPAINALQVISESDCNVHLGNHVFCITQKQIGDIISLCNPGKSVTVPESEFI
jgi:hypothetical protein